MGPLSSRDLDLKHVVDKVPEWQTAYGPGRIWIEEPRKKHSGRYFEKLLIPCLPIAYLNA